jgi:cytochrome P450
VYLLLTNPDKFNIPKTEIFGSFKSTTNMNFASEAKLSYLNACINEALSLYPPTPWTVALSTPKGGIKVDEVLVPEGVSCNKV